MKTPDSADDIRRTYQAFGTRFFLYLLYLMYAPSLPLMVLGADHYTAVPLVVLAVAICALDVWVALATRARQIATRALFSWVLSIAVAIVVFIAFNGSYQHARPLDFTASFSQYASIAMWAAILFPIWATAAWRALKPDGIQRLFV